MTAAEEIVVGIDVGTTSTKAGAYRLDGSAVATAQVETRLIRRGPGVVEQDPDELLASAFASVARCVERAGPGAGDGVAAIAVSGQMAGVLGIDRDWRPVTPYDSWLDGRCAPQLRRLAAEHGDLITARTGCPPMLDHAPKMQWWRDERPAAYAGTAAFVMPGVYVAGVLAGLSGADAFIDRTYLHFTGVADARSASWSPELLEALGLDGSKLPRIVASDALIGELTASAAERCGLSPGIPIAAGLGDTAAGALGAGMVRPGQLLDTAGTAAVLVGGVDAFSADPEQGLIVMAGAVPDQWLPLNYVAGGGLALPWLAALAAGTAASGADAATRWRRCSTRPPRCRRAPTGSPSSRTSRAGSRRTRRPCAAASSGSASPTGAPSSHAPSSRPWPSSTRRTCARCGASTPRSSSRPPG